MHRFVRRIGEAGARRPWVTIAGWLVAAATVLGLAATSGGTFTEEMVAPGSESEQAMELLEERFPEAADGNAMAVFAVDGGDQLDGHRAAIGSALTRIAEVEHVASVADPFAAGAVSPDGRIGYALITFDVAALDLGSEQVTALVEAIEPARGDGLSAEMGGDAVFINAEAEPSGAESIGLIAALVVLVIAFGALVAALVPVALALLAVGTGAGGIVLLANAMAVSDSAITIGVMIGLGVGIDYALFIVARYRENRSAGQSNQTALSNAMASSGSAVVLAGGIVIVAMAALVLTGLGALASIGIGTSLVVLTAVASALTLLPAMLTLLGDRIDKGRLRTRARRSPEQTTWWRFAHRVAGRPWPHLIAASGLLLVLGVPAVQMEIGFPDAGDDTAETTHRRAYDLLAEGFGEGFNGPLLVVADLTRAGAGASDVPELTEQIAADPGVASVGEPMTSAAGDTAVIPTIPTTAPADPETSETLDRIRELVPDNVAVTGLTALTDDLTDQLSDTLPIFIGAILAASIVLLMVVFRSVAVPLKAAIMNLLSIGAACGVIVAVFQWGWFGELFGLDGALTIASPLPIVLFAVVFGLSMDYEVFLLSRIREQYEITGDNTESVARGIASTGRVITSAALIMTAVFLSFVANPFPLISMMGLALATAIVLDATVVRMVLVPATMALLGRATWWLPGWLDRRLPYVNTESSEPEPQPEPEAALTQ